MALGFFPVIQSPNDPIAQSLNDPIAQSLNDFNHQISMLVLYNRS